MTDCECDAPDVRTGQERRVLRIALALTAAMVVIGALAGWIAQSTRLLADVLDMLSDATAYAIALMAIGRSALFRVRAAALSGGILLVLGVGVLVEVGSRFIYGAEPLSEWMIGTALLSLIVNFLANVKLLQPNPFRGCRNSANHAPATKKSKARSRAGLFCACRSHIRCPLYPRKRTFR